MNLCVIGTKGAGKGTQISRLADNFNLLPFSTGEMFRQAAKTKTPLGIVAEKALQRGELVPDEIVNGLVEEWLWTTAPEKGIVFDGFPRTMHQAEFLDGTLKDMGRKLDATVFLAVSESVVIQRLSGRRFCWICRDEFHLRSAPFKACRYQKCRGEFLKPFDEDRPEVLFTIIDVFKRGVQPVLDYYKKTERLIEINGDVSEGEIHQAVLDAVLRFR